ncbi:MAG: hypothetical protein U1E33_07660 [Rhodospirillales bacterium]
MEIRRRTSYYQQMSSITFDTLKLARKLEAAGFSAQQAADTAQALAETIGETIVTREYLDLRLAELKSSLKAELLTWMFGALAAQAGIIVTLLKLLP